MKTVKQKFKIGSKILKVKNLKRTIMAFSSLISCVFLFSMLACSGKSEVNKNTSSQLDTLSPKITPLDTALIDSSSILPAKSFKKDDDADPDKPHTLNGSN